MQTVPRASPRPAAAVPLTAVLPTTAVPVAAVLPTTTVPLTAVLPVTVTAVAVPAATALTGPALAPTGTIIAAIKSPATGKRRIACSLRLPHRGHQPPHPPCHAREGGHPVTHALAIRSTTVSTG